MEKNYFNKIKRFDISYLILKIAMNRKKNTTKLFPDDGKSPTKRFDYSPYLPSENGTPGKWLPEIPENKLFSDGYYVSKYWNMWYVPGAKIYEVEVEGVSRAECAGVEKQVCCSRIRLLKDVTADLVPTLPPAEFSDSENFANTGVGNTGKHNNRQLELRRL